jgi:hypothetical protein
MANQSKKQQIPRFARDDRRKVVARVAARLQTKKKQIPAFGRNDSRE